MSLLNQHWNTPKDGITTGRAPAQIRVMNDTPLSRPQYANVAHAYKLFTDAVRVALCGFLTQNRVFSDGTRVRMISNNGVDTVMVWPAGGEEEEFPPHGIGICFTDPTNAPVIDWRYKDADGVFHPQPVILRPHRKIVDGKYVGSGKWSYEKVSRLVGGKQMWVGANRRKWLSSFADARTQHPGATETQIINNRVLPSQQLLTVFAAWTATSNGRVGLGTSSDPAQLPFTDRGTYLFAQNDTVLLNVVNSNYQPFLTSLKLSGDIKSRDYAHVMTVDNDGRGLKLYRGYGRFRGLAEEDAELSPPNSPSRYLDRELVLVPMVEPGLRLYQNTLSAHPDGKRLICMAYGTSPADNGRHIDIDIATDGGVTYTVGNLGVWNGGAYAANGSGTWSVVTTYVPRYEYTTTFALPCWDGNGEVPSLVEHTAVSPRGVAAWRETVVYTANGTANTGRTNVWLNRYYYDRSGDAVTEKNTTVSSSSITNTYNRTTISDGGDSLNGVASDPFIDTDEYTVTSSGAYNLQQTVDLKARSLVINNTAITLTQTLASVGIQVGNPFSAAMTGSYVQTQRHILFYDPINDFIIYLETTITGSIEGSMNLPLGSRNVASLASGSGTANIVAKFKDTDVAFLDHAISLGVPNKTALCDQIASVAKGSLAGTTAIDSYNYGAIVHTATPATEDYLTAGTIPCGFGVVAGYWVDGRDTFSVSWDNLSDANSGTAKTTSDFVPALSFGYTSANLPQSYIQTDYAVDPVTLACVVHLSFNGGSMPGGLNTDKSWTVAVDNTGARPLGDVIKSATRIPDDVVIYKDAMLNSLVSI